MTVANGMYLVNEYNIVIPLQCYVVYITTIAGEYAMDHRSVKNNKYLWKRHFKFVYFPHYSSNARCQCKKIQTQSIIPRSVHTLQSSHLRVATDHNQEFEALYIK